MTATAGRISTQREGPVNPSTIIHQHSTRRKGAILALLCAAVIAVFVLIPRGPTLELYTTPPLDSKGTRIQLLIPRGWYATQIIPWHKSRYKVTTVELAGRESWLPGWAQR